jgi:hypothetical protein
VLIFAVPSIEPMNKKVMARVTRMAMAQRPTLARIPAGLRISIFMDSSEQAKINAYIIPQSEGFVHMVV